MPLARLKRILRLSALSVRASNGARDEFLPAADAPGRRKIIKFIPLPCRRCPPEPVEAHPFYFFSSPSAGKRAALPPAAGGRYAWRRRELRLLCSRRHLFRVGVECLAGGVVMCVGRGRAPPSCCLTGLMLVAGTGFEPVTFRL
jgi:hypothetical protein